MNRKTFIGLLALGGLVGCQPQGDTIEISRLPRFKPALDDQLNPIILSKSEVKSAISDLSDVINPNAFYSVTSHDRNYVLVDHDWMLELIKWWESLKWSIGLTYTKEGFDCDNFAKLLSSIAYLSAGLTDTEYNAQLLLGTISVYNKKSFGGIRGGDDAHMLNFFVSNKGIFILEPQSGSVIEYSKYPNIKWIYNVALN